MSLTIRPVQMSDLAQVVKIEARAFNMPLEMTRKDMIGRIENYPDTFLVAEMSGQVVGHVFGPASHDSYIKDELYYKNNPNKREYRYQTILSLAVAEKFRRRGIATALLTKMAEVAQSQKRQAITLTCLPDLFSFYEKRGYVNEGQTSADIPDPDDASSYNMVKTL